jgi:hypothetical protein
VVDEACGVEGARASGAVKGDWEVGCGGQWGHGLEADEAVGVLGFWGGGACDGGSSSCYGCAGRRTEGRFVGSLLSGTFEFLFSACSTGSA